jgi:hypothetical protein
MTEQMNTLLEAEIEVPMNDIPAEYLLQLDGKLVYFNDGVKKLDVKRIGDTIRICDVTLKIDPFGQGQTLYCNKGDITEETDDILYAACKMIEYGLNYDHLVVNKGANLPKTAREWVTMLADFVVTHERVTKWVSTQVTRVMNEASFGQQLKDTVRISFNDKDSIARSIKEIDESAD